MKIISLLLLFITIAFSSSINFEDNLKEAKEEAIKKNRPLMIMYSTPTCPECNYMKKKVFKNEEVSSYVNKNFVSVVMDINEDKKELPFKFIGIPSFFFVNARTMELLDKSLGGMREKEFLTVLEKVKK
ncbi:thioredoxin family protein [Arcobacter sp. CECT 8983]|uniref:thioredoxin family protein n=1 Tax=Arcobacter sp. CECT 8983 TaxID=2044508 RepID=UPI00100B3393|nr:thioredoxin family protein [Arcobacter sp. CECT 8983]RXJ90508.1 thioredoxin family protein [Arcobacter sp. CECT 8983]